MPLHGTPKPPSDAIAQEREHSCNSSYKKCDVRSQEATQKLEALGTPKPPCWQPLPRLVSVAAVLGVLGMLGLFVFHCIHASADMYSSPSIVLVTQQKGGLLAQPELRSYRDRTEELHLVTLKLEREGWVQLTGLGDKFGCHSLFSCSLAFYKATPG
eukprot:scaffold121830_cov18-Tisochrysis_lutea.AAC.1